MKNIYKKSIIKAKKRIVYNLLKENLSLKPKIKLDFLKVTPVINNNFTPISIILKKIQMIYQYKANKENKFQETLKS